MKTPTVQVLLVPRPPMLPRHNWPAFKPAEKPSKQSPYKTVLQFGAKGSSHVVRIIVEGRDRDAVEHYAREMTQP